MKKIMAMILAVLCCVSLVACAGGGTDQPDTTDAVVSETLSEETTVPEREFVFNRRSDNDKIMEGSYVSVSSVASQYVVKESDATYLKYSTPQFEIGGIKNPADNKSVFYRLDAKNKSQYSSFTNNKVASMLATHTAGGTLRFRTNASTIIVKASVTSYDSGIKFVGNRGTYGFDIYVGTGTAKEYCGGRMQMFANPTSMKETVKLPGGYVEVLINFPIYANVTDIQIGFTDTSVKIAPPLERDHDPIVFYGGGSVQGMGASRPGAAYANTVCRMLNTDCINQGYEGGAYGEQIMADYIAGLENISAFVMDYDYGPDLETLKATHYSFYKTVRDAHPDIPIVMISKPIFTDSPTADDLARVDVIKETYTKAMDAGDENVYFINGDNIFPSAKMADLCSVDMVHLADTGMYYMAMSVYDALAEAFNKTAE